MIIKNRSGLYNLLLEIADCQRHLLYFRENDDARKVFIPFFLERIQTLQLYKETITYQSYEQWLITYQQENQERGILL